MLQANEKRLLFVVGTLEGDEGITTQIEAHTERLQGRGWDVGLVSGIDAEKTGDNSNLQSLRNQVEEIFPATFPETLRSSSALVQSVSSFFDLKQAVDAFRPQVIHSHSLSLSPFLFLLRRVYDIPVVSTCHVEFDEERRDIDTAARITQVFDTFLGDRLIAISEKMRTLFSSQLHVPQDRIELIPHGVDDEYFRPPSPREQSSAREDFGLDDNDRVACLVGRLDPVKGHDVLFEALSQLKESGLTVYAVCAGTGGYEDEIKQQVVENGVAEQVLFPGFVDSRTAYWAADINVLPSFREGFPLVVPEAMFCGLPSIRTPAAGAEEQIEDGETGFIVPFDSPGELADRMHYLLTHPDERQKMGRVAAGTAAQHFGLDRSVDETEALYTSLIDN